MYENYQLLDMLPLPDEVTVNKHDGVTEVHWDDVGVSLVMNSDEVMFTQSDSGGIINAWDALWVDYTPAQLAERLKFYFE